MNDTEDIAADQRTLAQARENNILSMLAHLAKLAQVADTRNDEYWAAKDSLDQYVKEIMKMPKQDRPTGDQMAAAVGRDRRRLYQINKLPAEPSNTRHRRIPRRPQ